MERTKQSEKLSLEVLNNLYWGEKYSLLRIAKEYGINPSSVLKKMKRYGIKRRSLSESAYLSYLNKPQFSIRNDLKEAEKILLVAGIMLYWAEGTLQGDTIDFANSKPEIIKIFLAFLRKICGVAETRLRVYIYAFSDQDIEEIKKFWEKTTGIPKSQFVKPYIREARHSIERKRRMKYGLIKIRYSDKKLLGLIKNWIEQYTKIFLTEN